MVGEDWIIQIKKGFSKYKFVILILCIGVLLMTYPDRVINEQPVAEPTTDVKIQSKAEELESILGQIQGVGKVRVMISESAGAETIYQTDEDTSGTDEDPSVRRETVIISNGNKEQGLIRAVSPPVYLGAVVVCQGGGDPGVRLSVAQAVSSVTGIGSDRIAVLKMK